MNITLDRGDTEAGVALHRYLRLVAAADSPAALSELEQVLGEIFDGEPPSEEVVTRLAWLIYIAARAGKELAALGVRQMENVDELDALESLETVLRRELGVG